jgi:hypothetical protein
MRENALRLSKLVFFKLWSAFVDQVIRGDPQFVSEEKSLLELYLTLNE